MADPMDNSSVATQALTVTQLTSYIKECLGGSFPWVWVSGEVSNLSKPRSGHVYLTLKDDKAQLKCVIWRNTAERLRFDVEDGMEVIAGGGISVYEARGAYQLYIDNLQPLGVGALQLAFEKLRKQLTEEGLFDDDRKKPLPYIPKVIGIVTSPTGAAVRDILKTLNRRFPRVRVILAPVRVQGDGGGYKS